MNQSETLYTIGHSTRELNSFLQLLNDFNIELVVDVRRFPGSRKFPQFDQQNLQASLKEKKIDYLHIENLGGRRTPHKDSKNTVWRNKSFQAYADYMETEYFTVALHQLMDVALNQKTVIMCSEAVWWRCHRALISDYLKVKGWKVYHIININNVKEHPYTTAAKVKGHTLSYTE